MGGQRPVVDRQTYLFPGSPRVLFVKTVKGSLFPSTNQNYYQTCFPNLKSAIYSTLISHTDSKTMDNLLSFFPEIWNYREFSVPLVIPFCQIYSAPVSNRLEKLVNDKDMKVTTFSKRVSVRMELHPSLVQKSRLVGVKKYKK